MSTLLKRQMDLSSHMIQFCRYLRDHAFNIGPLEEMELLEAYKHAVPRSFEDQKRLMTAMLVKNRKQHIQFSSLYDTYWSELSKAEDSKNKEVEEEKQKKKNTQQQAPSIQALKNWLYAGRLEEETELAAYSGFEAISQKDFANFREEEQNELYAIIRLIAEKLANKISRRYKTSKKNKDLDLKASIRQALRKGGEIDVLIFKEQKIRKLNLILLCDVSKSMDLYSKFIIEFMHGFQSQIQSIKTFAFSTRLIPLTNLLQEGDLNKVLQNLSDHVPYWSGGTRIGESLHQFKKAYGSKYVNKDTVVMIVSDGWDTGDMEWLESSMRFLQKKSDKVIWINPLAGRDGYKPQTKGMELALPYIDVFTSAHNLESLQAIVPHLQKNKYKRNR